MDKIKSCLHLNTSLLKSVIMATLLIPVAFSSNTYAVLSDDGVKNYLPECYRSNKDDNTYTYTFEVNQYPNSGNSKKVFEVIRDVAKNSVSGDTVWDQCESFGALYVNPKTDSRQHNAAEAQKSIDSVLSYGGWTVVVDETGSSKPAVDYPQYFIDCRVQGRDRTTDTFDIWTTIRKRSDANSTSTVFTAVINDVKGTPRSSSTECAAHGINTNSETPHTEQEAQSIISSIKKSSEWEITQDFTSSEASDPNKYFVMCAYFPNLEGIEVESTHVDLYQGDVETYSYNYIYGGDFNPDKTIGYRDCKNWLGVGETYDKYVDTRTIPRVEITKEKYDEILEELKAAKALDEKYAEMYKNGELNSDDASAEPDPCYTNSESIGWVLCPILKKVSEALDGLYTNAVEPFLVVDSALVDTGSGTYKAWEVFISFANIIIVIFLLVVIFSQLTGVGIDNYGIKKSLPKLITVAILVNLSFLICTLAVDLSNILGNSLNSLLSGIDVSGVNLLSLEGSNTGLSVTSDNAEWFKTLFTITGAGLVGVGIAALASSIVSGGWFAGLVLPILLFFIVALVAVLFFFILLGVRKAGIVILIVLSPLAFACYMLPNAKKWFDRWFKALEGLLLLYPICGLMIGGGQLVSKILLTVSDDYVMYFTGCIVMVVPFFFIPTLLKGSFAALGNLGAKISGLGRTLGTRGRNRLDNTIRGSNRFKTNQAEIARRGQERSANRTIRRLERKGGNLSDRQKRLLARSHETVDKLNREDNAARTILTEREFKNKTEPELQSAWNQAFDSGDTGRLDSLTNVMSSRYGTGAANWMAKTLASKDIANNSIMQSSMRALQDNMLHNSTFANNMKNKASDAYSMISSAGMVHNSKTGSNEFHNLEYFSTNNPISKDAKDWSTQSSDTLKRAIDKGALTPDMIQRLLASTDPSIQSGIQSDQDKLDVLQASLQGASGLNDLDKNQIRDYANKYRNGLAQQAEAVRIETEQAKSDMIAAEQKYRDESLQALSDINQELRRHNSYQPQTPKRTDTDLNSDDVFMYGDG